MCQGSKVKSRDKQKTKKHLYFKDSHNSLSRRIVKNYLFKVSSIIEIEFSICSASCAMVEFSKIVLTGSCKSKALFNLDVILIAARELPPNSKKLSCTPIFS